MDIVYCPLCGKPNPVENKFCDFCLGHLKPPEPSPVGSDEKPELETEGDRQGLGGIETEAELPEWLKQIQKDEQDDTLRPSEPDSGAELSQAREADWLTEPLSEEAAAGASTARPFFSNQELPSSEDNPDWLDEALTEKEPEDIATDDYLVDRQPALSDEEVAEEAEPSKIGGKPPGALRVVGPLAGLKGALSAESGVAQIRKSAAYSTQLRVTENQRNHVELLESMITDEGQPQPLPRKAPISRQNVFRWAIGLIMLVVILWPVIVDSQQMPLPAPDEGSAEVNRLITQLPAEAKVLIGFDYEPGLTEELEAAAAPVIGHLMLKDSLLTLVSTSPSGTILAERLIKTLAGENEYTSGADYINLGYIPGGAAGLRSFAENPQGTLPSSTDDTPVWGTENSRPVPPLEGVDQVTDFDMVILLADDPDIARAWFEQLGSIISEPQVLTSFVAVTSAQLEPVVKPYFMGSPQFVNGMVTGLRGGATYSRLTGSENIALRYWDAFGIGAFTAAMLVLVGGLGYYVLPELARLGEPDSRGEG